MYELKVECHSSQLAIVFCALVDVVHNQSQLNCSIGLSLSASVITSKVEFWLMHEQWQLLAGNSCPGARPTPTLSCVVHILVGTTRWVQPPVVLATPGVDYGRINITLDVTPQDSDAGEVCFNVTIEDDSEVEQGLECLMVAIRLPDALSMVRIADGNESVMICIMDDDQS